MRGICLSDHKTKGSVVNKWLALSLCREKVPSWTLSQTEGLSVTSFPPKQFHCWSWFTFDLHFHGWRCFYINNYVNISSYTSVMLPPVCPEEPTPGI